MSDQTALLRDPTVSVIPHGGPNGYSVKGSDEEALSMSLPTPGLLSSERPTYGATADPLTPPRRGHGRHMYSNSSAGRPLSSPGPTSPSISRKGVDFHFGRGGGVGKTRHEPVRTVALALFHMIVVTLNTVQVWTSFFRDHRTRFVLMSALQFALLSLSYLLIRYEHKRAQSQGFIRFYHKANALVRFVFFTAAFGVCIICVAYLYLPDKGVGSFSRVDCLSALITLLDAIMFWAMLWYAHMSWRHNMSDPLPDAHIFGDVPSTLATPTLQSSPKASDARSLVKKQGRIIHFLKEKVSELGQELARTRQQIDAEASSEPSGAARGGSGRDAEYLLNQKEQQLRALRAERDRLRQEAHTARQEAAEFESVNVILRNEASDYMSTIDRQSETITQQTAEIHRLMVLSGVQKEANEVAQKTLEQYAGQSTTGST